jgi:hypothetical protein
MKKPTYIELLRDPRWQKKRLLKLEAAGWHCERCCDGSTMLQVHHKRYIKGRMPWEYDDAELAVLCEPCHEAEHEDKESRTTLLARLAVDGPVSVEDFFAFGAGAVSIFDWLLDPVVASIFQQINEDKKLQFQAGRVANLLSEILIRTEIPNVRVGMEQVAELFHGNEDFLLEFLALLSKHGIEGARPRNA